MAVSYSYELLQDYYNAYKHMVFGMCMSTDRDGKIKENKEICDECIKIVLDHIVPITDF